MKKLLLLVGLVVLVNGAIFAKDIFDDKRFQKLCGWVQDPEHRGTCWCFSGTKGNKSFKSVNGNAVLTEKGWNCQNGNWGYAISLKNKEEKWSSYRGTGEFEIGSTWGEFQKPKKDFLPLEKKLIRKKAENMEDNPKIRPPDFSSKKVLMKYSLQKIKDRNNINS